MAFQLRMGYLFSTAGLLHLLELILSVIVIICVSSAPAYWGGRSYMYFTSIVSMLTVLIFIFMYLFDIVNALGNLNWTFMRMVHSIFWALFYFIALWVSVAGSQYDKNKQAFAAAAVFSAFEFVAFGVDCVYHFYKNREVNSSQLGQQSA